jgi:CRP-like cAMP-binding protein
LPKDADGIYIIVEGGAKLDNKYRDDGKLAILTKKDYFGESKFLSQPGYSYFGAIEACQVEDGKEVVIKKKSSIKSGI